MGVIGFIVLILPSFSNSTQLWKQLISQCATQRVQLRFGKHGPHAIVPEYGCINSVDCIFRNGVDKSAPDLLLQEAEFEKAAAQIDFRCPGQIQARTGRSEEHTSETTVTNAHLVCRLLLDKKQT